MMLDLPNNELYTISSYFILTTVATVGYGDIPCNTVAEKMFCIVLMLAGVTVFSFISGAFSSIISNFDASQAALNEKLMFLQKLYQQYNLRLELYADIRAALSFDHQKNKVEGIEEFIENLPPHLRMEVFKEIHRDIFYKHDLFIMLGNKNFLAWIGQRIKPTFVNENQYIYQEGDQIDGFYFMTKGAAAFKIPWSNNVMYAIIDPEKSLNKNPRKAKVFQYFGCEDTVWNHC